MKTNNFLIYLSIILIGSYTYQTFFIVNDPLINSSIDKKTEQTSLQVRALNISTQNKSRALAAKKWASSGQTISSGVNATQELELPQSTVERLNWARDVIAAGSMEQKLKALQILIHLAPREATQLVRVLAVQSTTDPSAAVLVAQGMVGLTDAKQHFLNSDLLYIFEVGVPKIQKISALVMMERGDDALTRRYLDNIAENLKSNNALERSQALLEMSSMGSSSALPYALNSLNDTNAKVRMDALSLVALHGGESSISAVEILANDEDVDVKQRALQTLVALSSSHTIENLIALQEPISPPINQGEYIPPSEEISPPEFQDYSALTAEQYRELEVNTDSDADVYIEPNESTHLGFE